MWPMGLLDLEGGGLLGFFLLDALNSKQTMYMYITSINVNSLSMHVIWISSNFFFIKWLLFLRYRLRILLKNCVLTLNLIKELFQNLQIVLTFLLSKVINIGKSSRMSCLKPFSHTKQHNLHEQSWILFADF